MGMYANPFHQGPYDQQNIWGNYLNGIYEQLGSSLGHTYIKENFGNDYAQGWNTFSNVMQGERTKGYGNFLRNNYTNYLGQYQAMSHQNPAYEWYDFMLDMNPDQEFKLAKPSDRGEFIGQYAPTQRMVR